MRNALQHRNWISRMRQTAPCAALVFAAVLVSAIVTQAQTYTVLHSFDGTDGSFSLAPLVQATDGNLYGTTNQLTDSSGYGTIFKITTGGTLTSIYTFCPGGPPPSGFCPNGDGPVPGLVQATNGSLYGTTEFGGVASSGNPFGTVFKVNLLNDSLATLDSLIVEDASAPEPTAGLVQASNGDLYGTTTGGGDNGLGSVFKITQGGTLTTIYSFCSASDCGDGFGPVGGLIQATDGDLYGTTTGGGFYRGTQVNGGTIFKITQSGTLTTLYSFCAQTNCTDGLSPSSTLVQAGNGNFYGTTPLAGANGDGTIFEITPSGQLTTLYSFCSQANCTDGKNGGATSQPALIQATDGNLYGTTPYGGNTTSGVNSNGWGTIFEITPSGALTTLYTFCEVSGCADGAEPFGGLVQDTNGIFYGTTAVANGSVLGTVFSLSTGLGQFVVARPASGKVGGAVTILGSDLTGATSVTFNGTPATFTVVSSSEIKTSVPTGATSGFVVVTTPSSTLSSNVPFLLGTTLVQTTTTLSSSPNPSTSGEAVTFTALISPNAGAPSNGETVTFEKGTTVLGTGTLSGGSASFTTSTLPVGTTLVKAVYGGDAYFKKSTSNVVKQLVEKAAN